MRFNTALTSFLFAATTLASPVATVQSRDLCHVGVPCVVQYEINVAVSAVNQATALVKANVQAAAAPSGPVIDAINVAATTLVKIAGELQVEVGGLSGDARVQLQGYVVAAISTAVSEIRAGVAIIASVSASGSATVSAGVAEGTNAVLTFIAAIEAVVGPCYPTNISS